MKNLSKIFLFVPLCVALNASATFNFEFKTNTSFFYSSQLIEYSVSPDEDKQLSLYRISIEDSLGNELLSQFLYLKDSTYLGSFRIPEFAISGSYIFKCWDMWDTENNYASTIHIINLESFNGEEVSGSVSENNINPDFPKLDPLSISGTVTKDGKNIGSEVIVVFQSRGGTELFEYSITNEKGEFSFERPLFGECEVFFSVPEDKFNEYVIKLDNFNYSSTEYVKPVPFKLPENILKIDSLKKALIEKNNTESDSAESKIEFNLIKYNREVLVENFLLMPSTYDLMKDIVTLKKMRTHKNITTFRLLNFNSNLLFKGEPLYIVDGFRVENFQRVLDLSLESIESVRSSHLVGENSTILGRFGVSGVVFVTTKNGDYIPKNGKFERVQGFIRP